MSQLGRVTAAPAGIPQEQSNALRGDSASFQDPGGLTEDLRALMPKTQEHALETAT